MQVAHLLRARESKELLLDPERLLDVAADLEGDAFGLVREAGLELLESEAGEVVDRPLSFRKRAHADTLPNRATKHAGDTFTSGRQLDALSVSTMTAFLVHLVVTAALLLLVAHWVRGVHVEGWGSALIGALVLGLINAVVRPILVVLTFPLTILTFGLFLLVVNALMLWLMAGLVPGIRVRGFGAALIGSLVFSVLNLVVELLLGPAWPRA